IIIPTDETALFNKTLAADAEFRDLDRAVRALYDNQHETRIIMGAQPIFRALIRAGVNTIKVPSKHADDPKAILKTAAKTLAKVRAKNAPPKGSAKTLIARIMLAYDHYRGTFELRSECKRNSMYWPRLDWETEQAKADIIALYKAITNTPKAEALFEDAFPIYAERVYRVVGGPNKDLIGTRAKKMKKGIEPPQP
ncbi:MAG: hypothetical protein U9N14_07930, partial [Pseudomonadota bacterium]|nr:hypothetical protein [Pseudomonadota bacterium]